jgi:hypothetical protein
VTHLDTTTTTTEGAARASAAGAIRLVRTDCDLAGFREAWAGEQMLALLRTVNLVSDRREGKNAFYSLRASLPPKTLSLIKAAIESVGELEVMSEDRENLDRILQKRRRTQEQYFNLIAGRLGKHSENACWN